MLYIFFVNNGIMMKFDVQLAIETVENLKWAIFKRYQIPVNCQVLLISGGESLQQNNRVCDYSSAGTDTSPIFLFCKNQTELFSLDGAGVIPNMKDQTDDDMKDRVQSCLEMEVNVNTVASRNEMAKQLYENDTKLCRTCDKLNNEQHLQQLGWSAVVANLEDIVSLFANKANKVEYLYSEILKNKSNYQSLLANFENDKEMLSKIPILKCLIPKKENTENLTLLEWIVKKDRPNSLDELYCSDELDEYDEDKLNNIKIKVSELLANCNNSDMKEIKGLEQRLSALDKLIWEANNILEKQEILKKGFNQNQNRYSQFLDPTILPDLCQNHKEQLQNMLQNHLELITLKNKCLKAKQELSDNLNKRLKWIVHVEEKLKDMDETLIVIGIKLQKLCKKLKIVQCLHTCPQVYFESIVEVLRRKFFTDMFYNWSENISQTSKQLVEQEIEARERFSQQLEDHFLKCFFPGMNDLPQNFISKPIRIDQCLPQIDVNDIEFLKKTLPEMSNHLVVPSVVPVSSMTPIDAKQQQQQQPTSSSPSSSSESTIIHRKNVSTNTQLSMDYIERLESDKTKMNQFLAEKNKTIQYLKNNDQKKMNLLNNLRSTVTDMIDFFKSSKDVTKILINNHSKDFSKDLENFKTIFNHIESSTKHLTERNQKYQETIIELDGKITQIEMELNNKKEELDQTKHKLSGEKKKNNQHSNRMEELKEKTKILKSIIRNSDSLLKESKTIIENLNSELAIYQSEFRELFNELKDKQLSTLEENLKLKTKQINESHQKSIESIKQEISTETDRQIQKLRDQLNFDHKSELETLRQRFKLAISTTSIERTGSETSLEKVQLEIVDPSAQEKEIQKLKSLLNEQKNEYEQRMVMLKSGYENSIKALKAEFEQKEKQRQQSTTTTGNEFNEMNMDFLFQKVSSYESILSRINQKVLESKNQLQNSKPMTVADLLSALSMDLNEFQPGGIEMVNSRSFISLPTTNSSSLENPKIGVNIDDISLGLNLDKKIEVESCDIGDTVLVYYEKKFENWIVFSLNDNLHYIHSDSLKECDISKNSGSNPENEAIVAKVTEKEYCQIKKKENRYKLPVNTRFYRVKIQQLSKCPSANIVKLKQIAQAASSNCHPHYQHPTSSSTVVPTSSSNILSSLMMSLFGGNGSGASSTTIDSYHQQTESLPSSSLSRSCHQIDNTANNNNNTNTSSDNSSNKFV